MDPKFPDITVQLTGRDGNAFAIIGAVSGAIRRAGHIDEAKQFVEEAMSGDYDNVLRTALNWVTVA
jgi:hypothetical protein